MQADAAGRACDDDDDDDEVVVWSGHTDETGSTSVDDSWVCSRTEG